MKWLSVQRAPGRVVSGSLAAALLLALLVRPAAAQVFGGASVLDFSGDGGGVAGSGFTTVLPGTAAPQPDRLALDRAAGHLTIDATAGSLDGGGQDNALATLFDARQPYSVAARLAGRWSAPGSAGIYVGLGADSHARLALATSTGGASLRFALVVGGVTTLEASTPIAAADFERARSVDLALTAAPASGSLTAQYRLNGEDNSAFRTVKQATLPPSFVSPSLYAGIHASGSAGAPFRPTFDWFKIVEPLQQNSVPEPTISFNRATIFSRLDASGFDRPTTLALGPDGRLYAATQRGQIFALTLDATKRVTASQLISTIADTPSLNDDGTPANFPGRLVLGLAFDPESPPERPVLYVTHSDPRVASDKMKINTRSSTLTRLVGPDYSQATRVDVVTGMPRSRDNHAINGLGWGPDGWIYIAIAGNTNYGAPSAYFSNLPEAYLSAAVLRANVKAPGFAPLDVGHVTRASDMAPLAGQFEIFATGFRNPYDLVWHTNGRLYVNMNNGNSGFGLTPDASCPGGAAINPGDGKDMLFVIKRGDYAGHPNPARGECIYGDGSAYSPDKQPLDHYVSPILPYGRGSFDGIAEYRAPVFNGAMRGNLLTVNYRTDRSLRRIALSADGSSVRLNQTLATFNAPLDVVAAADGTIFVADHGGDELVALTPNSSGSCPLIGDPAGLDSDEDGFSDQDEIDAKTAVCSASSTPRDVDGDRLADLRDPDDDNDRRPDVDDQFPYDQFDGRNTPLPVALEWNPGDEPLGGYQDTGFTGAQIAARGTRELPGHVSVGVAGGFMGILATDGTSAGPNNSQSNALQLGFDATRPFMITTLLPDLFLDGPPAGEQSGGLLFGLNQDNYVKLVVGADPSAGGATVQFSIERGGELTRNPTGQNPRIALPGPEAVELFLEGDPARGLLRASYRVDSDDEAAIVPIGTLSAADHPALASFFVRGAAAGLLTTNAGGGSPQNFGFDYFRISGQPDTQPPQLTARQPASGAVGVSVDTLVTATFDEPVTGVSGATFTLTPRGGAGPLPAAVTYDPIAQVATLDPSEPLTPGMVYDVTLTQGIADSAGNALVPETWTFAAQPAAAGPIYTRFLPLVGR